MLSGPDGSCHSSKQHLKDVGSGNSKIWPGKFVLPKARSQGADFVFAIFEFLFQLPRNSRASQTETLIFCLFGLLWPKVAEGSFEGTCDHRICRGRLTLCPHSFLVSSEGSRLKANESAQPPLEIKSTSALLCPLASAKFPWAAMIFSRPIPASCSSQVRQCAMLRNP